MKDVSGRHSPLWHFAAAAQRVVSIVNHAKFYKWALKRRIPLRRLFIFSLIYLCSLNSCFGSAQLSARPCTQCCRLPARQNGHSCSRSTHYCTSQDVVLSSLHPDCPLLRPYDGDTWKSVASLNSKSPMHCVSLFTQFYKQVAPLVADWTRGIKLLLNYCAGNAEKPIQVCLMCSSGKRWRPAGEILKKMFGKWNLLVRETLGDIASI